MVEPSNQRLGSFFNFILISAGVLCFLWLLLFGLMILGNVANEIAKQNYSKQFEKTVGFYKEFLHLEDCLYKSNTKSEQCVVKLQGLLSKFDPELRMTFGPVVNGKRQLGFFRNPAMNSRKIGSPECQLEMAAREVGFERWDIGMSYLPAPYVKPNSLLFFDNHLGIRIKLSNGKFLLKRHDGKVDVTVFSNSPIFVDEQMNLRDSICLLIGEYYAENFLGETSIEDFSKAQSDSKHISFIHNDFAQLLTEQERNGLEPMFLDSSIPIRRWKESAKLYYDDETIKGLKSLRKI